MVPLVSVIMPCFNSTRTLPLALASLIIQTHQEWECILVDDGSTDNPAEVVRRAADRRIRYIRLDRNMGRGVARQVALDHARGDLLCMLDADDWIFPEKIERQVEVMQSEPETALVSTGMAIVDAANELIGVRCRGLDSRSPTVKPPLDHLEPPSIAHAPSMIRMEVARKIGYDARYPLVEDFDFLLKILMEHCHCVLGDISYVYFEEATATLDKMLSSLHYSRRIFWSHRHRYPLTSRWQIARAFGKSFVYRAAYALGREPSLLRRRSQPPTPADVEAFRLARRTVTTLADRLFGPEAGASIAATVPPSSDD